MNFTALYTTNTLHSIASYCSPLEQLALHCVSKEVYKLPRAYLTLTTRVLLSPLEYHSEKYLPELISALTLCLLHNFKSQAQKLLPLIRTLVPMHVIHDDTNSQIFRSLYRVASDAQIPSYSAIFDLTPEVAQKLYLHAIVRDHKIYPMLNEPLPAPPQYMRVLFILDRAKILPFFNTHLQGARVRKGKAYLKLIAPGMYGVEAYTKQNGVIASSRDQLGEVFLWYLWITCYYACHDFHAESGIHGRFITPHDIHTFGVSGLIREVRMLSR